ncbi:MULTISPECIES: acetate--CoA ligase family protein [unclassified Pseudonocardia]|uniref:acetate--CoA ligase family protein n=1 Tax=unclassified Pseudonocardia TaxID=2619320 RepID=UPI0001FFE958|nr:acetate--CoA ligase family protein [Pseudonocardia sp. Ae707_Ps1]OLM18883.1 Protein acetyltransferase [Pseudonocardia sp. Ae707_Ps1]
MTQLTDRPAGAAGPARSDVGRALLAPRSVAIVGASDDARKTTARPLRFLREAGFTGGVYPVNPRRETVLGERAWPDIASLPEVPDHVFVLTDTARVVDTVRECGEAGVPLVTVLSGGFGEGGPEGRERLDALLDVAHRYGVRVVGPNSIGVVNPRNGMLLTANAAFAEPDLPVGPSFVASQSGSVIGALMTRAKARGLGFAGFVSTGSEVDLTLGEICEATLDDPEIGSYTLFVESMENAGPLARFAAAAAERGRPVTVYKLGRSDAAAALSVSHTGALAGEDDEADAFFRACGFARVDNFEALIEAEALQRRIGPPGPVRADRIGVITSTGGGAAIVVDQLETRGVTVARPSPAVFRGLAALGLDVAENLIVDLTLAGTRHDLVLGALDVLRSSGEFDLVLFVVGSSARLNPELAVSAIAEAAAGGEVPLAAWALPDALDSLRMLNDAGVPAFRTAEACAEAVAATMARRPVDPAVLGTRDTGAAEAPARTLDESDSAGVLAGLGVSFPAATTCDAAGAPAAEPAWPVVVKALSDRLPHKSDAGAVVLGVTGPDELAGAVRTITANVAAHDPTIELGGFLVQEMVGDAVVEALVGYRVSPSVGPLVMLAAGGVHAELYDDSTLRLAPVTAEVAREMVGEVTAMRIARGFRGGPAGDIDALVDTVVAVSRLAVTRPDVVEAEVNPVAVRPRGKGAVALDALVREADRS